MRTYILAIILAIAIAALFAIPTTAFSGSITLDTEVSGQGPATATTASTIVTKASTIATKANGAENCDQPACTKKD